MSEAGHSGSGGFELQPTGAPHPLIRKLSNFTTLLPEERDAILAATSRPMDFAAGDDIAHRGGRTGTVKLLLEGFACRYKILEDGRRQIIAYLVPGDLCDLHVFLLDRMDHSIAALTNSKVATLSPASILKFTDRYPNLTRALWWTTLLDEAITREWVVSIGQRTAYERMAHLFCELFYRLRAIGETQDRSFYLPLTQVALGDTLGLSSVHVNRTLQDIRRHGLISFKSAVLTIKNLSALEKAAFFNPDYLHMGSNVERPPFFDSQA